RPDTLILQKGDVDEKKYDTVQVTLKFDKPSGGDAIVLPAVKFGETLSKDGFVISGETLAAELFKKFGPKFGPEATNPPCALTATAQLKFTPKAGGAALERKTTNNLTINWIRAPQCCDKCDKDK